MWKKKIFPVIFAVVVLEILAVVLDWLFARPAVLISVLSISACLLFLWKRFNRDRNRY